MGISLEKMEDDFHIARDRMFRKKENKPTFKHDCKIGIHFYEYLKSYDKIYDWWKCATCGIKCLMLKKEPKK